MSHNQTTTPSHWRQVNLALALAFIPCYLYFTFMPAHILRIINDWLESLQLSIRYDTLLSITLYWLLPALIIFLLMRFTHFERWLKVNLLAHLGIFISNLCLLLLVAAIVFYNERMYVLFSLRDQILITAWTFAAMVTVANMIWHYLIKPNEKVRTWLLEDVFASSLK